MAKEKTVFVCQSCNAQYPKWAGKCTSCNEWNTLEERKESPKAKQSSFSGSVGRLEITDLKTKSPAPKRVLTGISEFDRVIGGGLVEGSVILLAGDPGAGKSTLILQVMAKLSELSPVVYVSGEENKDQIQIRAERLGVSNADIKLITSGDAIAVADMMESMERGSFVVIDSMQTMDGGEGGFSGSISQVKASASHIIPVAKNRGITTILINHVTKEGGFAGPQVLKHAVDTSLLLQNDARQGYMRILRCDKNRFGSDDEIGLFSMTERGMEIIENPSEMFIGERIKGEFGTVVYASLEGTRPLLIEVQALVTPTTFGTGRRQATGWDAQRMNMILAMMSARTGLDLSSHDVYVNVAGGMKISDPAMDMAVVIAIISAYNREPVKDGIAVFGEVGLAGEIRGAMRPEARFKEALTMGFEKVICPQDTFRRGADNLKKHALPIDRAARIIVNSAQIFNQEKK